jgi:hypothetical protein
MSDLILNFFTDIYIVFNSFLLELSFSISSIGILLIMILFRSQFERLDQVGLDLFFFMSLFLQLIFSYFIVPWNCPNLICQATRFAC